LRELPSKATAHQFSEHRTITTLYAGGRGRLMLYVLMYIFGGRVHRDGGADAF
jgi:hypothetical protein